MEIDLVGKNVKVIQKDRYVVIGKLLDINSSYIVLEYFDGRKEVIAFPEIRTIKQIEDNAHKMHNVGDGNEYTRK